MEANNLGEKTNSSQHISPELKPISPEPEPTITLVNIHEAALSINSLLPSVNTACKAIITIPVYKEFRHGRIADTLQDLAGQTVDSNSYEIVLVVNNPAPEHDKFGMAARQDNTELINYIRQKQTEEMLTNVRIIDCTDGQLPQRHIGLARGLGNEVAAIRFDATQIGDEGIIIQLDGDVSVAPDFLEKILKQYQGDPTLESSLIGKMPLPVDFDGDDYYLGMAEDFMQNVCSHLLSKSVIGSGQAISFRARIHSNPRFREYIKNNTNEDLMQGLTLPPNSRFRVLAEPRVYVADRIRPEGFDATNRNFYTRHRLKSDVLMQLLQIISNKTFSSTPAIVDETLLQLAKPLEISGKVIDEIEKADPLTGQKLRSYISEETDLAYERLDATKADDGKIALGALVFALSRLGLDTIES